MVLVDAADTPSTWRVTDTGWRGCNLKKIQGPPTNVKLSTFKFYGSLYEPPNGSKGTCLCSYIVGSSRTSSLLLVDAADSPNAWRVADTGRRVCNLEIQCCKFQTSHLNHLCIYMSARVSVLSRILQWGVHFGMHGVFTS